MTSILKPTYGIRCVTIITLLAIHFYSRAQSSITSNLPIVVISTGGVPMKDVSRIPATFKITAPGENSLHHFDSNAASNAFQFEGFIDIEIVGNTWEKRSFGIETLDAPEGSSIPVSLLGMPEESDWVLNASYGDKSIIRETMAHEMYSRMGRYSPRSRYVEVYLQELGELAYQGIYLLMEKIKPSPNRIPVPRLTQTDTDPTVISGGYILRIGENRDFKWTSRIPPFASPTQPKQVFHVAYPELHKYLNVESSGLQFAYIKSKIDQFEQVLNSPGFKHPTTGYRPFIDVDAMVDYLLLQEFTKNLDSWRTNAFLYKNRDQDGGRIVMGAPWDFDKALGNQQFCYQQTVQPTNGWAWQFNIGCPFGSPLTVAWPNQLLTDCFFKGKVMRRYRELRLSEWSDENVEAFIDQKYAELTAQSAIDRNFARWDILEVPVMFNEFYPLPGNTHQKEVIYLKEWIHDHLEWMDYNLASISSENCDVLPVTYKDFRVMDNEQQVRVEWSTSDELHNERFEVERSSDAAHFEMIGTVSGSGTTRDLNRYEFLDVDPLDGTSYYRIRQVDTDGSFQYTAIRNVHRAAAAPVVIYPNPSKSYVELKNIAAGATIRIRDRNGKNVASLLSKGREMHISVDAFRAGNYILTIHDKNGNLTSSHNLVLSN